ncbi:MAG: hypothetical protein RIR95_285 [Pseudomonadota bacterium]
MIVAGIGFRRGASVAALTEALLIAEARSAVRATALATDHSKANAAALCSLAATLGLPVLAVKVAGIETQTQSLRVKEMFGTGSLAEAAALVGAGPGAQLLGTRVVSSDGAATVALAKGVGR